MMMVAQQAEVEANEDVWNRESVWAREKEQKTIDLHRMTAVANSRSGVGGPLINCLRKWYLRRISSSISSLKNWLKFWMWQFELGGRDGSRGYSAVSPLNVFPSFIELPPRQTNWNRFREISTFLLGIKLAKIIVEMCMAKADTNQRKSINLRSDWMSRTSNCSVMSLVLVSRYWLFPSRD